MMTRQIKYKISFVKKYILDNYLFIIASLLFAVVMNNIKISADDISVWGRSGDCLSEWWKFSLDAYNTWSSRTIVNFIWFVILHCNKIVRSIFFGLSLYVMLKGLESLFPCKDNKKIRLYILFIIMLFPFVALSTAGWVATFATYFSPLAFGVYSLIPIRYLFEKKKMRIFQFAFCCLALIYAANEEQMMVVMLFSYGAIFVYMCVNRMVDWRITLLFFLSVLSAWYVLSCPGNLERGYVEETRWFPTYSMLDFVDRLDLGISTTLYWLFFGNNLFVIASLLMFAIFIFSRYNDVLFRLIALIPLSFTVMFGPFMTITGMVFPQAIRLASDIEINGAFTVENEGMGVGLIQFVIMLVLVLCVLIEVFLLNNTLEGMIADYVVMIAGVASRVALGFSPTIYASSIRTFTIMIVSIIVVSVHLFSINIDLCACETKRWNIYRFVMYIMIVVSFVNLSFLVNTFFYE